MLDRSSALLHRGPHMPQRRFDRRQNHVQSYVNEIYAGKRNYQVAAQNDSLIQDVIDDVHERKLIACILVGKNNRAWLGPHRCLTRLSLSGFTWTRSSSIVGLGRETKEYGGHGPVHSIWRTSAQR